MHLRDHVDLVPGGSRGIRAAIADRLPSEGARVAITYSTQQNAAVQVVEQLQRNGRAMALHADLSKLTSLSETFEQVVSELGALGIVVAMPEA